MTQNKRPCSNFAISMFYQLRVKNYDLEVLLNTICAIYGVEG